MPPDRGEACACTRAGGIEVSPDTAVLRSGLVKVRAQVFAAEYYTRTLLACPTCGARYEVVDDQSYWKPLYTWTRDDTG